MERTRGEELSFDIDPCTPSPSRALVCATDHALFITNNESNRTMPSYAALTHLERLIGGSGRHELHQTPSSEKLCRSVGAEKMVPKTEHDIFSGAKIYTGKGIRFIHSDSHVFLFSNSKCK
ncbi:Zinc finger protein VAR3, chloroplastic [Hordeum vulgare]|nr:Zinc finger protein VAR3, chloroplastic [Hordeum vulgare]